MTHIKTINELKNYVGKIIVCYYYKDYYKEFQDPNLQRTCNEENIKYLWIMKLKGFERLSSVFTQTSANNIRNLNLSGTYIACLIDRGLDCRNFQPRLISVNGSANAQSYIRTPTKEELIKYNNIIRHARFFGLNE